MPVPLQKFSGTLVRMSRERTNQSFAPGEHDQQVVGAIAVGAALVGAAGQAATLATVASDPSEPADWVECELDDGTKFHGWLWRSPFKKGDAVEIIATTTTEGNDQRHRLFAMARPRDRLVALYPHCSRGRYAHWKAFFWGWCKSPHYTQLLPLE